MAISLTVDEEEIAEAIYMGEISLGELLWRVAADQVAEDEGLDFARRVAGQAHATDVTEGRGRPYSRRLTELLRSIAAGIEAQGCAPADEQCAQPDELPDELPDGPGARLAETPESVE